MSSANPSKKTALVAGAGIAGLSSALYLDDLGYDVTLIERKPILGGRTYSFQDRISGLTIDNGQHLMIGAYHETFALLERLGSKHKVHIEKPTTVPLYDDAFKLNRFTLFSGKPPWPLLKAMLGFGAFSFSEKFSFLKLGRMLKQYLADAKTIPIDITVKDWLKQAGQKDRAIKNFWEILTLATLNDRADTTTADGLIQVLLKSYFGGNEDGLLIFPKAGLSELFANPAEAYLNLRHQKIIKGVGIQEVQILDGKVRNVILSSGEELKPDLFVSALPFRQLLKILPRGFVQHHEQLKHVHTYQSSPIISINLFFDRPVLKNKFIGTASANVHWFFDRNALDLGATPLDNTWHHVCGVISGAYDHLELSRDQLVELALSDLRKICPDVHEAQLKHSLVNKEREATLSSRPNVNATRPSQHILSNFYIVGDWTQTHLPATIESAAKSAKLFYDALVSSNSRP